MKIGDHVRAAQDLGVSLCGPKVPAGATGVIEEHDPGRGAYRVDFGPFHGGPRWTKRDDLCPDGRHNASQGTRFVH